MTLTALAATMAVNTLVTGLIVFKILKVFLENKATSVEQTIGSLRSDAGRPKLQRIVFIIIESGMALFAAHLVHIVIFILIQANQSPSSGFIFAFDLAVVFHQSLNVIIKFCSFLLFCFTDNIHL